MDWSFLEDRKTISIGDIAKRLVIEEGILTEHHPLYYERLHYWSYQIARAISAKNPQLSKEMERRNIDTLFQFLRTDGFDFKAWYEARNPGKENSRKSPLGSERVGAETNHATSPNTKPIRSTIRPRKRQQREHNPGAFLHRVMDAFEDAEKRTPTPAELWKKIKDGGKTADVVEITADEVILCDRRKLTLGIVHRWYRRSAFQDNKDINDQ